jgi:hypothetical protein
MSYLMRFCSALALVAILAVGCAGTGASSPATTATPTLTTATPTLAATPVPTEAPTAKPTATPIPMTDGKGPEHVIGIESGLRVTQSGTETVVGEVTELRGQEMTSLETLNDPRVTGTSQITLNGDLHGTVMAEWGTTRLENADGAWVGTWTGASWNDGSATSVSGWLAGSGAYAGYTYYFHVYGPSTPFQVEGIIFEGTAPPVVGE